MSEGVSELTSEGGGREGGGREGGGRGGKKGVREVVNE